VVWLPLKAELHLSVLLALLVVVVEIQEPVRAVAALRVLVRAKHPGVAAAAWGKPLVNATALPAQLAALVLVDLLATEQCQMVALEFTVFPVVVVVVVAAEVPPEAVVAQYRLITHQEPQQPQTPGAAGVAARAITAQTPVALVALVLSVSGGLNKELICNTHSSKTILLKT
jgi:hypothetical protein